MSSSILTSFQRSGHSADVKMHLVLDGQTLSVGHLGLDYLILDAPIDHPPSTALLYFSIDGKERERKIRLPNGISMASPRVGIANA